jgi:murein DD-endopeptidase MepM/ murein hydrolase activator NlpD
LAYRLFLLFITLLSFAVSTTRPATAQTTCGVVRAIDYPLEINDTFENEFDDFSRFRRRFGGLHTGIDLAFNREGDPVRAAADGRVTYANTEGWDTEKGVVIIRHDFPDGSIYYSLYGHMEERDGVVFPEVGTCVERGDIVGVVGDPSLSAPHLHYEIRNFMPDDGGPGYVQNNPRSLGWFHPLDFTDLWRIKLQPGFISSVTLDTATDLTPMVLDNGFIAAVAGPTLTAVTMPDVRQWQVTAAQDIAAAVALPGGRVAILTGSGAVSVLDAGRYVALWSVDPLVVAPVSLGDTIIVAEADGLTGYDPTGNVRWQVETLYTTAEQVMALATNGATVALTVRDTGRYRWVLLDGAGNLLYERDLRLNPVVTPGPLGGWVLLDGAEVVRVEGTQAQSVGSLGQTHGRNAALTADVLGNTYIYLGDNADTFLSLSPTGEVRWRLTYPFAGARLAPVMAAGGGCILYTLDMDGILNLFDAETGGLVQQQVLYAGGDDTTRPGARLLRADVNERLLVGAGFQSIVLLDGRALAPATANCLLG